MLNIFKRLKKGTATSSAAIAFDQYEMALPSHQNAVNALPGWNSAFPVETNLEAGKHHLYADDRIAWALQCYGSVKGKTVLEVGPLEGMHTHMLNVGRPARIDAIEANKLCFLRCLVTKQVMNIDAATFLLGDIQEWLENTETVYDFALASGVLYHMSDPGEFLRRLSLKAKSVFIWTHFFLDEAMPLGDVRRHPFSGKVDERIIDGMPLRYYERSYQHANTNASFCGGMNDKHFWMHRDDILSLLEKLGYNEITIKEEDLTHTGGPCFSLFARRD